MFFNIGVDSTEAQFAALYCTQLRSLALGCDVGCLEEDHYPSLTSLAVCRFDGDVPFSGEMFRSFPALRQLDVNLGDCTPSFFAQETDYFQQVAPQLHGLACDLHADRDRSQDEMQEDYASLGRLALHASAACNCVPFPLWPSCLRLCGRIAPRSLRSPPPSMQQT